MSLLLLCLGWWLLMAPSRGRIGRPGRRGFPLRGRDAAALIAGVGVVALVGGPGGLALGAAIGLAARWLLGRVGGEDSGRRERLLRQAPDAVECLAACVTAGAPLWAAMEVVADSFGGPIAVVLRGSAARHHLGAPHEETFAQMLADPVLAPVGRVLLRSVESGASLSAALITCADQMRHVRGAELENRARAVGVKAVAPLALCFLPAFIVLAVVPIIGSLVTELL
ncbi:MAG: type II secretion system F family protein [Actinobacteria bacterium]|nr:type II secretion system F family protein [Actinomycetota bacterium]MCB8997921.1 type II secretion system F family protein [Actinomycetota bacterium]MCB9414482.1 type II secretion system F family protein [Actinomycetota bacterium]HRY08742.1 type II secretion system F family protein [Candidatus Nanopelagicales bacterium]